MSISFCAAGCSRFCQVEMIYSALRMADCDLPPTTAVAMEIGMDKKQQWHAWYFVAAVIGVIFLQQMWAWNQKTDIIPYSQFLDDLNAGNIAEVRIAGDYIEGERKKPAKDGNRAFV